MDNGTRAELTTREVTDFIARFESRLKSMIAEEARRR